MPVGKDLYYPEALEWMWNYCIFLGKFEHEGKKYDLGVYQEPAGPISAAIVYGSEDGQYMSGLIGTPYDDPIYEETWKRWEIRKSSTVGRVETMLNL